MSSFHIPVLLKEAIEYLNIKPNCRYIDANAGGGGHSLGIIQKHGKLLAIDVDPEALEATRERLSSACPIQTRSGSDAPWRLAQANFAKLAEVANKENFVPVCGILFDLGVSSHQLETASRGFSFNLEGPLDMRMDPTLRVTAANLVKGLNKGELEQLFFKLGGEHNARKIAQEIIEARKLKPITTCNDHAQIIIKVQPKRGKYDRTHPATRCFQALRIAVNDELNNLTNVLPQAMDLLEEKGRLVIISFHSGEDKIIKNFYRKMFSEGKIRLITKKPIRPSKEEIERNPRSHSAKMRVAEKI